MFTHLRWRPQICDDSPDVISRMLRVMPALETVLMEGNPVALAFAQALAHTSGDGGGGAANVPEWLLPLLADANLRIRCVAQFSQFWA